ncbi:hypothetical protein, partial [Stutzerimonas kunmingensis]|uniref:hypothetical protein n=1 Tax=Stutzerimonas kunmingensis TaxID=1211807 RepID=UPI00289C70D2
LEKLFITVTRTAAMISHRIRFFAMSFKLTTLWSKPVVCGPHDGRLVARPNLLHNVLELAAGL